jgi:hypothetical protein
MLGFQGSVQIFGRALENTGQANCCEQMCVQQAATFGWSSFLESPLVGKKAYRRNHMDET